MDALTTTKLVQWVISHGYFLFFVAAFLEGPLVTAAAGVACALGYYSIEIIVMLAILGDLTADLVYYSIGYFGGRPVIDRYGKYVGLTHERMLKLQKLLHNHARKTLVAIKLSPLIPVPGIIMIGSAKVPPRTFIETSLFVTLPKALLFALIGYYSGKAYTHISGIVAGSQYAFWGVGLLIIIVFLAYQRITRYYSKNVE